MDGNIVTIRPALSGVFLVFSGFTIGGRFGGGEEAERGALADEIAEGDGEDGGADDDGENGWWWTVC